MKKLCFIALLLAPTLAFAQLEWRISIKVFTNANGSLPQSPSWHLGSNTLYQGLSNGVAIANNVLDTTGRGYRWRLLDITNVSGTTTPLPTSTNSWFNLSVNSANQDNLDASVKANPAGFAFRANAINFYYVNATTGPNGGYCAGPTENQDVILLAPNSFSDVLIHEAGHFFSLLHTHDGQAFNNQNGSPCTNNNCTCAIWIPAHGDATRISDTILDHQCLGSREQIAVANYGMLYANLQPSQQQLVLNTWLNIMSYHSPGSLFTDDQMDRMTDSSNDSSQRFNVANGRTRFIATTGNDSSGNGSSTSQYRTVNKGVTMAVNGDIVLFRAGNYNEQPTLSKPVTLRATRGSATIGKP